MPLTAVRHVRKMRGGAQAQLLEANDGHWYVVKFRNNPQHRRVLVNESISHTVLEYLNVAVPETAVIEVTAPFLAANPDLYIQLGARVWRLNRAGSSGADSPAIPTFLPSMTFCRTRCWARLPIWMISGHSGIR